ncbi:MAG: TetR/AcrR family transcriptional regulator [Aristaeellaceae bacterium]
MNRSERKYFTTAARMDAAFLELLEKKGLAFITVKEICQKAGVNRSTFYLHYETINDLLAESARFIIDQFIASMPHDASAFIAKLQTCPLEELYLITPEYLTPYLNYVKEHRRIFRTTLEQASVLGMNDAYLSLTRHVFTPILDRFHIPPFEQKYIMPFYINGLMGIVNEWLKEDCKDSTEHIISVMQICIAKYQR